MIFLRFLFLLAFQSASIQVGPQRWSFALVGGVEPAAEIVQIGCGNVLTDFTGTRQAMNDYFRECRRAAGLPPICPDAYQPGCPEFAGYWDSANRRWALSGIQ